MRRMSWLRRVMISLAGLALAGCAGAPSMLRPLREARGLLRGIDTHIDRESDRP